MVDEPGEPLRKMVLALTAAGMPISLLVRLTTPLVLTGALMRMLSLKDRWVLMFRFAWPRSSAALTTTLGAFRTKVRFEAADVTVIGALIVMLLLACSVTWLSNSRVATWPAVMRLAAPEKSL